MLYLYQRLILDPDNNVYVHMTVHESDNKIKSLSFFLPSSHGFQNGGNVGHPWGTIFFSILPLQLQRPILMDNSAKIIFLFFAFQCYHHFGRYPLTSVGYLKQLLI